MWTLKVWVVGGQKRSSHIRDVGRCLTSEHALMTEANLRVTPDPVLLYCALL